MIADILRAPGRALWRLAANRLIAPALTEQLIYWRAESLYWTGVVHADGPGEHEEEAEIHASEGAETAIRRLADGISVSRDALPDEGRTQNEAVSRLRVRLEADERGALTVLDRLGPSKRLPVGERTRDYMEAADAELLLTRADMVAGYLDQFSGSTNERDTGRPRPGAVEGA